MDRKLLIGALALFVCTSAAWSRAAPEPAGTPADAHPGPFVHPGMLHARADLDRMRANVHAGVEPWKGAWDAFLACPLLARDYRPRPRETAGRDKKSNVGQAAL